MPDNPRIVVLGAGVAGIGTALAIQQKIPNCLLTVYSERFTPNTTGDGAAGLWMPHSSEVPDDKVVKWCLDTWNLWKEWKEQGNKAVLEMPCIIINKDEEPIDPKWQQTFKEFRYMTQPELKFYGDDYTCGFKFQTLVTPARFFLPNLMKEISTNGGQFRTRKIHSLADVCHEADVIVNCTGVGALDVAKDKTVYPIRGQVLKVKAPWINYCLQDHTEGQRSYIIQNPDSVVLGCIRQVNDWRTSVDPQDSAEILRKITKIDPSLLGAEIVEEWAGLRPGRKEGIRIEKDHFRFNAKDIPVVHNYGHAGRGVMMFWGCAQEAAHLTAEIVHENFFPVHKL